jgi:hypothetical protein
MQAMIRSLEPVETPTGTDGIPAKTQVEVWEGVCEEREGSLTATVARVVQERDRRRKTQFLTLGGSNELTCPTASCQWIAGRLGLRVEDAGDCRESPSRHISAKGAMGLGQSLCLHAGSRA